MNEPLAHYSFLPWLRQGAASSILQVDNFGADAGSGSTRATVRYQVRVNEHKVAKDVLLVGPGDFDGMDRRAIVRREPQDRVTNFEPNYLPFVEFYDEDFPWRYTPARATGDHRLRPWLALIVLKEEEFQKAPTEKLPAIVVNDVAASLPKADQLWGWAHVHVNENLLLNPGEGVEAAATRLRERLQTDPDVAASRLICPRRLHPETAYHAFLVPTFESGRRAGLGQEVSDSVGVKAAWSAGSVILPYYDRWSFRTGEFGDFEYLVRLLKPRTLDPRIGIRDMDVQEPGIGLPPPGPAVLGLEGALKTPQTEPTAWPDPSDFQTELATQLNLPADLKKPGSSADPIVTAPLYGQWHARSPRVMTGSTPPWIDDLNLDPRTRAGAGLGTLVIQQNQEPYMQRAWSQVGEVLRANQLLIQAQLSWLMSRNIYHQHFQNLPPVKLVQWSAPLLAKVKGSPKTLRHLLRKSRVPELVVDRALRRIERPRGPISRRSSGSGPRNSGLFQSIQEGRTAAPAKQPGDKLFTFDRVEASVKSDVSGASPLPSPRALLVAIAIALVMAIALAATGAGLLLSGVSGVIAAVAAGALPASIRAARRIEAAAVLQEKQLSSEAIQGMGSRPGFRLTSSGEVPPVLGVFGSDSEQAVRFRAAASTIHRVTGWSVPATEERRAFEIDRAHQKLLGAMNPDLSMRKQLFAQVRFRHQQFRALTLDSLNLADIQQPAKIEPILAAPDFPDPMYEKLRDMDPDLLVPNLHLLPPNTISLLEANRPFIEAYMVGLNHEMARELLWREYPTDRRGSYFRQFWDVTDVVTEGITEEEREEKLRDITPLHQWSGSSSLGEHPNQPSTVAKPLVLVIRGDLFRRYPNAVVSAVPASWPSNVLAQARDFDLEKEMLPSFGAQVGDDIHFFGFDVEAEEAKGSSIRDDGKPGWFFIIRERPGEPRFGLDVAKEGQPTVNHWNDLRWSNVVANAGDLEGVQHIDLSQSLHNTNVSQPPNVDWGQDSSRMAYILFQTPVLIAVHAADMLQGLGEEP